MPLTPIEPLASEALETTAIPVDLASDTYKILYRVVTGPLSPGEALDISADARVSNAVGYPNGARYTVGVGWHLWAYSYTNPLRISGPWWRISHLMGSNATPDLHHLDLHISRWYRVPEDWPPGHRMVIVLRADAHSTAWKSNGGGDTLTVDSGYGQLIVRPWVAPPPAPPAPVEA